MKEPLLNPVKPAPDERYCDWVDIDGHGQAVRCANGPIVKNVEHNWKLCSEHKAKFRDDWELIWEPIKQ